MAPAVARLDATIDDMDKLTKGIKKIKINLITQSQKEARQREAQEKARLEAEQAAAAKSPREQRTTSAGTNRSAESGDLKTPNSTTGRRSTINATSPDGTVPALSTTSGSGLSTPNLEHFTPRTISPDARQTVPNVVGEQADFFVPYQPEGPAPVAISSQEPLQWLPPTLPAHTPVGTPNVLKKKTSALFQYGSSSGVPFAPKQSVQRTPSPQHKLQRKPSGVIRGVPRSPPRK